MDVAVPGVPCNVSEYQWRSQGTVKVGIGPGGFGAGPGDAPLHFGGIQDKLV